MTEGFIKTGDGCRIAWQADGPKDAPVLVLSNSLGTTMAMWAPQIEALSARYRVIRYDTRGHGRSDVPAGAYGLDRLGRDVLELAEGLGLQHFAFCGLSLGGMTGQWLGVRASAKVTSLIIANSSPFMGPPDAWDSRIAFVREKGMKAILDSVLQRWFTIEFGCHPANVAAVRDMLLRTDLNGYVGCCAAIRDMDLRPMLGLIRLPTLVIGGSRDPATPPDHTHALVDGIVGARCVMLDAAHLSNVELPAAFTEAVLDHLK